MSDYRAELAEKKKKLDELRRKRAEAQQAGAAQAAAGVRASVARPSTSPTAPTTGAAERLAKMRADRAERQRLAEGATAGEGDASSPSARLPSGDIGGTRPNTSSADMLTMLSGVSPAELSRIQRAQRAPFKLVRPDRLQWDLAPQGKADHYTKQVQTEDTGDFASDKSPAGSPQRTDFRRVLGGGRGEPSPTPQEQAAPEDDAAIEDLPDPEGLSQEEKERILGGMDFRRFFDDATFLVERALKDDDLLIPGTSDSDEAVRVGGAGEAILRRLTLSDPKLTKNCPVTSVDFNSCHTGNPELFVASYYKREMDASVMADVEGTVLVWSMRVVERPYLHLRAPCDVARTMYCKYNGALVLGSMYNGQVCVWDTRAGERPVQLSPLTMDGHTYPVFGMEVVGTTNSHSLVTLSSDGRLCTWQLDKLATPTDSMHLQQNVDVGGTVVPKDIQATSLGFRDMDTSRYFVGSDSGLLFSGNKSSPATNPETLEGHTSPITSLHCHPVNPGYHEDFADLVLTSSMDWTCKLWQPARGNKPLFSFDEYTDFVYDVKWSPEHPAVFASVDGAGFLSVYHIGDSMETPLAKAQVPETGASHKSSRACSCLSWTGDGRFIGVGDSGGDMSIWQVSQRVAEPKQQDWVQLSSKLHETNAV